MECKVDGHLNDGKRPRNIGILAMEIYFPSAYVKHQELGIA